MPVLPYQLQSTKRAILPELCIRGCTVLQFGANKYCVNYFYIMNDLITKLITHQVRRSIKQVQI